MFIGNIISLSMESLRIRQTKLEDYPMLVQWWKDWHWTPVPQEVLPDNGTNGIMVEYNEKPICCGFIYATSSPVLFHMEWIVSDFKMKDREIRNKALDLLVKNLCDIAYNMGCKVLYTSVYSQNKSLIDKYQEFGFVKGSNSVEMIKTFSSKN